MFQTIPPVPPRLLHRPRCPARQAPWHPTRGKGTYPHTNPEGSWADTAEGPTSLRVENYAHGSDSALDSWVVLVRDEGGASGAE